MAGACDEHRVAIQVHGISLMGLHTADIEKPIIIQIDGENHVCPTIHKIFTKGLGLPHTIRLNSGPRMDQGRAKGYVSRFRHAVWQNSEAEHARHRPESERGKSCEFSAISCEWCWSAGGWRSAIWEPACSTASPLSVFRSDCNHSRWPSLRSGRSARKSSTCRFQILQSRQSNP